MSALSLWLEISAENKQVRSKGKLCSKLMPRCKNVPRALSICQQRERSTLFSLSLPHSTVCCILKIRACTGNSWRCLPPLHLRPSTHSQRQKIPEPETETETETAPSWSCRAAGTQLLLASFSVAFAAASFLPTDKLPASKEGERERRKKGRGKQSTVAWRDAWNCLGECSLCSICFFLATCHEWFTCRRQRRQDVQVPQRGLHLLATAAAAAQLRDAT